MKKSKNKHQRTHFSFPTLNPISILVGFLVVFSLILTSWYVLHQDIFFYTDVARDFLLMGEISQKKIVLLGPRSSTNGLFHGPLWMYLNYPAYWIGHGNPVVVGWYWILLITVFLLTSYFIAKRLLSVGVARLYILLLSVHLVFHGYELFNPHGALFLLPAFIYFFVRYLDTQQVKYLLLHLFITGLIIQFQMAIGIPLLLLSNIVLVFNIIKAKQWRHFLAFAVLLIPLASFILFDIRHDFLQLKSVIAYLHPPASSQSQSYGAILLDRLHMFSSYGLQFLRDDRGYLNFLLFMVCLGFLFINKNEQKFRTARISLAYFYTGYIVLSVVNKGVVLYHQYFPLMALTFLLFSSFFISKYRYIFLIIFCCVYLLNMQSAFSFIQQSDQFIGKSQFSWKFLNSMAKRAYSVPDNNFGYFVYSPDAVGYQAHYALAYQKQFTTKQAEEYSKKPVTYLIAAPPPKDNPYMKDEWWRINKLHLSQKPTNVITFPNGYTIQRYQLSQAEQSTPFDPAINTGLHFR